MKLGEIFETRLEDRTDPVIRVDERQNEAKLASEIAGYVVTPAIENELHSFLEHWTDTYKGQTEEIGHWISGPLGAGRSHLAKLISLLVENRSVRGLPAVARFDERVPEDAALRVPLVRIFARLGDCVTRVLPLNLLDLARGQTAELAHLMLAAYYQSRGYSSRLVYARTIEHAIDLRGQLGVLHREVESLAGKPWTEVRKAPELFASPIARAVVKIVPDLFSSEEAVQLALKEAERVELYNTRLLIKTLFDDLAASERALRMPCRALLILDEAEQWIKEQPARLVQLLALVEEAAIIGKGRIWITVVSQGEMRGVLEKAGALAPHVKRAEARFRLRSRLSPDEVEQAVAVRSLAKTAAGQAEARKVYDAAPASLHRLTTFVGSDGKLPATDGERFVASYPFLPYQLALIPAVLRQLHARRGDGEAGPGATLVGLLQEILRGGRRKYLEAAVGELVTLDEVAAVLDRLGQLPEGLSQQLEDAAKMKGASDLTRRVAEVMFLVGEAGGMPVTVENIARCLADSPSAELGLLQPRVKAEVDRLCTGRFASRETVGYRFLFGGRREHESSVQVDLEPPPPPKPEGLVATLARGQMVSATEAALGDEFQENTIPERQQHEIPEGADAGWGEAGDLDDLVTTQPSAAPLPDLGAAMATTRPSETETRARMIRARKDAREIVRRLLDDLPGRLERLGLDDELAWEMGAPLLELMSTIDGEAPPEQVFGYPESARALVAAVEKTIEEEVEKRKSKRTVCRLLVSEITDERVVHSVEEWEALLKKIDAQVRALLANVDVEFE